jgi:outer membrane protein TolC
MRRLRLLLAGALACATLPAQEAARSEPIDLVTVLRLAGAESLDVKLAEARVSEARANADGATWALFPTLSPGVAYRKHSGQLQDIVGQVLDVNKESLSAGATLGVSLELGEAVYRRLAARQTASAAEHQLEAQRRMTVLAAAASYFELTRSHHAVILLEDGVRTAKEYRGQLAKGVGAGVAFKGDELRAAAAVSRLELRLRQALELRRGDAARLAQVLRLKITETLVPADDRPLPLSFATAARKLDDHVRVAMAKRPELQAAGALQQAAAYQDDAATYAPLYPTLGAQVFAGGLGGSQGSVRRDFDTSADTFVTLSWKIGAGGLFDGSRQDRARSHLRQAELSRAKASDEIVRQVVEAHAGVHYLAEQVKIAEEAVRNAEQAYRLSLDRKELAIGVVLETLQSQQDLIQARLDYAQTVGESNKAHYRLKAATGE